VTPPFRPADIIAALEAHGVDYVLVGGLALIAHGAVRATLDADVVPAPNHANLTRLLAAMNELDAVPYGDPGTPVDIDLIGRDANMRFLSRAGQIDLLLSNDYRERFASLRERAVRAHAGAIAAWVVGRDDLIALKLATGRDRDLLDVGDLLALDDDGEPSGER
jgi:hypothetical protein